jgi:hypothetical protein
MDPAVVRRARPKAAGWFARGPAPDVCRTCRSDDEHIDHVVAHAPHVGDLDDDTRWLLREIPFGPQQVRRG